MLNNEEPSLAASTLGKTNEPSEGLANLLEKLMDPDCAIKFAIKGNLKNQGIKNSSYAVAIQKFLSCNVPDEPTLMKQFEEYSLDKSFNCNYFCPAGSNVYSNAPMLPQLNPPEMHHPMGLPLQNMYNYALNAAEETNQKKRRNCPYSLRQKPKKKALENAAEEDEFEARPAYSSKVTTFQPSLLQRSISADYCKGYNPTTNYAAYKDNNAPILLNRPDHSLRFDTHNFQAPLKREVVTDPQSLPSGATTFEATILG